MNQLINILNDEVDRLIAENLQGESETSTMMARNLIATSLNRLAKDLLKEEVNPFAEPLPPLPMTIEEAAAAQLRSQIDGN